MQGPDGKEITFVEWHKYGKELRPHSVATESSMYDVNYCESDGATYYHESGGGVRETAIVYRFGDTSKISGWIFSTAKLVDEDGKELTRKTLRERGYVRVKELTEDPLEDAIEGEVEWCNVCESHVPADDTCRHICYGYDGCDYSLGAGSPEINVEGTKRSLFRLFRWIPIECLKLLADIVSDQSYKGLFHSDSILGGDCRYDFKSTAGWVCLYLEPLQRDSDVDDRYRPGIAWLYSLDEKTRLQNGLTAGWIWEFMQDRHITSIGIELESVSENILTCELGYSPGETIQVTEKQMGRYRGAVEFRKDPSSLEQISISTKDEHLTFNVTEAWSSGDGLYDVRLGVLFQKSRESLTEKNPHIVATSWSRYKGKKRREKKQ